MLPALHVLKCTMLCGHHAHGECACRWLRPTCDVVGMWGGFTEEGIKTIVPAVGHAKVACRLVPDQAPEVSPAPHEVPQTVHITSCHSKQTRIFCLNSCQL